MQKLQAKLIDVHRHTESKLRDATKAGCWLISLAEKELTTGSSCSCNE